MRTDAPAAIPVLIAFPDGARDEGWGRFTDLSASRARLVTRTWAKKGEGLLLAFELGGEGFREAPCVAERSARDADGYYVHDLKFTDEVLKRRLARALLDLMSRA